jgi:hypothetical protein
VQSKTGLDLGAVSINPDEVKFEDIVPPAEPEEDESLERMLGLEPRPEREVHDHRDTRRSDEDADDIEDDGESVEAPKAAADAEEEGE